MSNVHTLLKFIVAVKNYQTVAWKVKVAQSCLILCSPVDCSLPAPLSMEFSRPEYWSGQPFPSLGDHPNSNNTNLLPSSSGGQKFRMDWRDGIPSGGSRRESISLPFPVLEAAWTFYSIFKLSSIASANFSLSLTLILLPPSFPYKDLYDYLGPIKKNQDNQRSPPRNSSAYSHCKVPFAITYWQGD